MLKRIISEGVARWAIYALSGLALAGTVLFAFSARATSAAEDEAEAPPPAAVSSAAQQAGGTAPPAATGGKMASPVSSSSAVQSGAVPQSAGASSAGGAATDDGVSASGSDAAPSDVTAAAGEPAASDTLPPIQLGEGMPDPEALEAELARLGATGVALPDLINPEYMGEFYATAYCCEEYKHICGGNGVTASGTKPTQGLTAAADWRVLPPGTWLYIEDVGIRRVEDSGSAIKQQRLDIAIDTHANALRWRGLGNHRVWVLAWSAKATR